eukprot:TRINITY_DN8188_c0_g1_i1.p1 TRINITY_DN8188_c0_g1~~TRINITY_DN8188_c0_g1_i1.p1  ORF type:complete len:175 (+),score=15.88 TRINITY_DN8188_c0_g1_i1:37-561(+)
MECLKKINFKLIGSMILPLAGSLLIGLIPGAQMDREWFNNLNKPALNPPSWLFAPVWTYLYLSMGLASYLVYKAGGERLNGPAGIPLAIYIAQLLINWSWSPIFFGFKQIVLAFYILVVIDIGVATTMIAFFRLSIIAGLLFIPYLVWVSFATYLSYSIMELNPSSDGIDDLIM